MFLPKDLLMYSASIDSTNLSILTVGWINDQLREELVRREQNRPPTWTARSKQLVIALLTGFAALSRWAGAVAI
jgi:hypothetical protein